MKQHHKLKLFNEYFQPTVDCKKRSTVRFDDRNYQVGDVITFMDGYLSKGEFKYSGKTVSAEISYIDNFGLQPGYVSLSLCRVGMMVVE